MRTQPQAPSSSVPLGMAKEEGTRARVATASAEYHSFQPLNYGPPSQNVRQRGIFPTRGTSDDNPYAVYIWLVWLRGIVLPPGARGPGEQPHRTGATAAGARDSVDVEMGTERAW